MKALFAALLLLVLADPAAAEMVKWEDANGTVHFAESLGEIPPQFRAQAAEVPTYSAEDERVRIIPKEPEEEEDSSSWFFGSFGAGESKPKAGAAASSSTSSSKPASRSSQQVPEFNFVQILSLVVVQFFVSIFVLAACAVLIGERVENLGGKSFGSIFAQRFLMFAAFLWISHTSTMNFVPQSISLADIAKVLITPVIAELGIMTVILRYTICDVFARAAMLSVLFCMIDGMAQGLLLFGAIIVVS